ncbi:MAG: hypothetical protein F6K04_09730 [Leptolyngbya sp. SIO4C5]|nr:hypothetical protein [Leptolyngbya sp. SIO4C5]
MKTQFAKFSSIFGLLFFIVIFLQSYRHRQIENSQLVDLQLLKRIEQQKENQLILSQKIPTFGFRNLVADWFFLQFLQYFGDVLSRQQVGYGLSPYFFEILVSLDPLFTETYIYLSNSVSIHTAQPEKSISLMKKGLSTMSPATPSDSYFIWRYKAVDELLFLGDKEAARQSLETAAEWARESPDPKSNNVAELSEKTAAFLAENPNSKAAQVSAWAQILVNAVDERTQEIAIERIEALGGEIIVQEGGQVTVRYNLND